MITIQFNFQFGKVIPVAVFRSDIIQRQGIGYDRAKFWLCQPFEGDTLAQVFGKRLMGTWWGMWAAVQETCSKNM